MDKRVPLSVGDTPRPCKKIWPGVVFLPSLWAKLGLEAGFSSTPTKVGAN